jgi:hypothetical protein
MGDLPMRLLSDHAHENAHRFHSYDDFEDMELHSTILIDKLGRVYWARTGGEPFSDMDFLMKQLVRMNDLARRESSSAPSRALSSAQELERASQKWCRVIRKLDAIAVSLRKSLPPCRPTCFAWKLLLPNCSAQ